MDKDNVSVVLGITSAQGLLVEAASRLQRPVWVKALREAGLPEDQVQAACDRIASQYVPWQESTFPGLLGNVAAGRIANRLNLGVTNCVTDAACASALSALSLAVYELQLGHSDLVIAGGVETFNDIFMFMCFSKTPALSPTGDCRPFDAEAHGTMLGEGLGFVGLKRLADAERDGDPIYAVIKGIGSQHLSNGPIWQRIHFFGCGVRTGSKAMNLLQRSGRTGFPIRSTRDHGSHARPWPAGTR